MLGIFPLKGANCIFDSKMPLLQFINVRELAEQLVLIINALSTISIIMKKLE